MEDFKERAREAWLAIVSMFRSTKEAYEGANRFARMRIWIISILAVDIVVTVVAVLSLGGREIDVVVWFQPAFPSNMLVVRNESGETLKDVTFVLDRRYTYKVERVEPGPNGYEVNRDFRDKKDFAPSDEYRPQNLVLRTDGESFLIPVNVRQ